MAPPRPAKRQARSRAAPNPSPATNGSDLILQAAQDGGLRLLKRLVSARDEGPREAVEAARDKGVGALHLAAMNGRLSVCRYLVEELGVAVDSVHRKARTPLFWAMNGRSVSYLLDSGANPAEVYDEGDNPLHLAAARGNCEMVELLLAKGVSVDPVSVSGTPLHVAASNGTDEAMKVLLENKADYNKRVPGADAPILLAIVASSVKCVKLLVKAGANVNGGLVPPLAAAAYKGLTECLKCLLEAGANPNVPEPSGMMPVEIAALYGSREDVEILFPVTSCIPTVNDWSIDGIIRHAKSVSVEQGEDSKVRSLEDCKSLAVDYMMRNDNLAAAQLYTMAMEYDRHDTTLLSNRSSCWHRMGDGRKALQDALACREMRPAWPKACYREGAALMLLKDYGSACDAFLDATKLDPWNPEIEAALREALNLLKMSDRGKAKAV